MRFTIEKAKEWFKINEDMQKLEDKCKRQAIDISKRIDKIHNLQDTNKRQQKQIEELKETLEHRDSVLSIMYDLVRCDYIKPKLKLDIIKAVIDDECWNFDDLTEKEKELWNYFWKWWFR